MTTCRVLFIVAASLHIPVSLFPSREQIYIFYRIKPTNLQHAGLTIIMSFIALVVPTVYPNVIDILGLVGGITVGLSGFIIPMLLKVRSLDALKWYNLEKLKFRALLIAEIFLCLGSVYCSVFKPDY